MRGVSAVFKSIVYVLSIFGMYYIHGFYSNEYYGYGQIKFDAKYFGILTLSVLFIAYVLMRKYKKPSDYFLLLYGLIVVAPYALLYDIRGLNGGNILFNILLIVFPFFCILLFCRVKLGLPKLFIISENKITEILLLMSVLTVFVLLLNPPSDASFSLADSYTRRLEARDVYGAGTLISYFSAIVMNGIIPLFAFVGVLRKKTRLVVAAMLLYLGIYYIYGVKAPMMYIIFAGTFANSLRKNNNDGERFYCHIFYFFLFIFLGAWLEFLIFDYSYLEDYIIRRLFYVGSHLQGVYLELVNDVRFSWMHGLSMEKSASMYVGEDVLGSPGTNANTNTFLHFLIQYGIGGYLSVILIVSGVLVLLDSLRFRGDAFVLLSLMYSVLILEQSATTALLSSGIGILSICFFFSRRVVSNKNRASMPQG